MSIEETDRQAAAVATHPRVTLADIEANIAARYDFTGEGAVAGFSPAVPVCDPLRILSICILVTNNGYTIIGKAAPASPENFNRELGIKFAYEDAVRQLWPIMGYHLRQELYDNAEAAAAMAS